MYIHVQCINRFPLTTITTETSIVREVEHATSSCTCYHMAKLKSSFMNWWLNYRFRKNKHGVRRSRYSKEVNVHRCCTVHEYNFWKVGTWRNIFWPLDFLLLMMSFYKVTSFFIIFISWRSISLLSINYNRPILEIFSLRKRKETWISNNIWYVEFDS
jgi:hypothetical protein